MPNCAPRHLSADIPGCARPWAQQGEMVRRRRTVPKRQRFECRCGRGRPHSVATERGLDPYRAVILPVCCHNFLLKRCPAEKVSERPPWSTRGGPSLKARSAGRRARVDDSDNRYQCASRGHGCPRSELRLAWTGCKRGLNNRVSTPMIDSSGFPPNLQTRTNGQAKQ